MSSEDDVIAPAVKAFLIADLLLRGDAWQEGWVMEDGSLLILDERMPEGFIAAGTSKGPIVVGQITELDNHDS